MTIATYSDLQTTVANWLNRTDLTSTIPDLITLAESRLSSDLKSRSMETKVTLSTVANTVIVAIPSDMVEMRRIQVLSNPNIVLSYRTPDEISQDYPYGQTGTPTVFTVVGNNIEVYPIPDGVYSLELTYVQRIPALSASNTTNWCLTSWPNVYLFATLLEAAPFLMNDERIPVWKQKYQEAVQGVNSVDWYSGSTMKVRVK